MPPPQKPMTMLSMEAIFQNMDVEKIWDIRKKNMTLREVINEIPPKKLQKQFPIGTADVEGQIISIREGGEQMNTVAIEGVSQTRWVSPETLTLKNSNAETVKKSFLPVATAFCKRMKALEVTDTSNEDSTEYFNSLLKLLESCPLIEAIGILLRNLTEEQLSKLFDSLNLNREDDLAKEFTINVRASANVTPEIVEKFLKTAGTRRRQFLIQEEEEGETLQITNEAIKKIFVTVEGDEEPWGHEQKIYIERLERQRALTLIEELRVEFPAGAVENGPRERLAFFVFHDQWNKGFIVENAYTI